MILCFPDLDTFHLAATGTLLPSALTLAPARLRFEADGRIFVETEGKVSKKTAGELTALRVTAAKAIPGPTEELSCWPQALELEKDESPALSTQAPVIFEVSDPAVLPQLVGEMLRLGNDRQSYCWLDTGTARRILLRVVGPPYYTLLQSLDPHFSGTVRSLAAFVERAPRVWVQMGYRHAVGDKIKLPEDRMLLIRPGRDWTYLDNPPFRDIYEALQFPIGANETSWEPVAAPEKLTVPLKLAAGNAAEAPEFWVLRDAAAERLDAFVRDADDRLLQRLRFAVSEPEAGSESVIVLRLSPSKLPPPVLALPDALGFKPYFKLTNLFVPTGKRLHPQLRRDAVRTLLAGDPDRVVWLRPLPDGEFVPESIAEDAFRPLEHWVDYILESSPAPLKAWVAATEFDFETFVCSDTPPKPRGPDRGPRDRGRGKETDTHTPLQPETPVAAETAAATGIGSAATKPIDDERRIDEWKVRRQVLQDAFQKVDGGLDQPQRQSLWPELARANTGAGDPAEAAICWVNAMWEQDSLPADLVRGWYRTEHPGRGELSGGNAVEEAEFDALLRSQNPDRVEVRQLASSALACLIRDPVPAWFRARLPDIQQYVESNDAKLPVRAVWLIAVEMAALTGADVLGLARVRDRILQRLLDSGLNAETDLPFFLRTAGLRDSERVRSVRDRAVALHRLCRKWAESTSASPYVYKAKDNSATLPYIDLLFAFGFAKLGESSAARSIVEKIRREVDPSGKPDVKSLTKKHLYEGFIYRIEEVLAGKVPSRTLPTDLISAIEQLAVLGKNVNNSPHKDSYYAIMRLRSFSLVLEPFEKHDRLNNTPRSGDEFESALFALHEVHNASELMRRVRSLYRGGVGGKVARPALAVRLMTLHAALPWAIRAGEAFTLELLALVPETLIESPAFAEVAEATKKQGELLERALFYAAHFDRRDHVHRLLDQFIELIGAKPFDQRCELINSAAQQCLRCLRRFGLRDEIDKMLGRLHLLALEGGDLAKLKSRLASRPSDWGKALRSLLNLAGGWLYFGNYDMANPILDEARAELLSPAKPIGSQIGQLISVDTTKLCRSYVAAIGQGRSESGLDRLSELFVAIDPNRTTIGGSNAQCYSEQHFSIVEEVVLAIVSDDFALGPVGRRWLDEDEFLVRRRIHRDMRATLADSRL